jgi:predicted short-subunit dehydrogenase-like oxidoreductase (DUF2520 family)
VSGPLLHVAGAGAVGTTLAAALARQGWPLGEIACRTLDRARARCALIGGGTPTTIEALADPDRPADPAPVLLLIGVPDRAIREVGDGLARRCWPEGSVALHLSGAIEVDSLAALARAGLATGGLHPLKSFVDVEHDVATLAGTVMAIEGAPQAASLAEAVAARLGGEPFRLAAGCRPAWHAAASHACNHLVALVDQALDLMQAAGLPRDDARHALLPLLRGTLDNLSTHPPGEALTGPVVRGDVPAVERHLQALAGRADDLSAAYRALARRAVALAVEERGLPADVAGRLIELLRPGASGRPGG